MKRFLSFFLVFSMAVGFTLPGFASAKSQSDSQKSPIEVLKQTENSSTFILKDNDGKEYLFEQTTKNPGKSTEKIVVKQFLLENSKKTLVKTSSADVQKAKANIMKKCHGISGRKGNILFLNSCVVKKVLDIVDDASSASGAIAGITALLRTIPQVSVIAGAVAGVLWVEKFLIDKVSAGGKYGIYFVIVFNKPSPIPIRQ
ncbi:hypothetical protein ABE057_16530 [Bacillus paralicheniformis]|uniref:hypothetical protein n=1 Tax=Bacillus TaxID=1386 RepID=UPI0011A3EB01|nr:hypothetical protein [Bacillus paralicheniformis]MSO01050.1 hypothetical protein [Bacillus paralicheniformis]MSO05058.1 hypothetical protein [Bacillus paralicheniformis]MSO09051.1 hypothetical protein [Bacillus paralicheniformis]MSO13045.1 hypothetical protein [Bacillus paralicheniformis]NJE39458.1 hypothetical protein [Bacillus paralicheniformis]